MELSQHYLNKNSKFNDAVFDNIKRSVMSLEKYESKLHILENHRKRLDLINKIEEEKNKKHEDIDEYLEMLKNI